MRPMQCNTLENNPHPGGGGDLWQKIKSEGGGEDMFFFEENIFLLPMSIEHMTGRFMRFIYKFFIPPKIHKLLASHRTKYVSPQFRGEHFFHRTLEFETALFSIFCGVNRSSGNPECKFLMLVGISSARRGSLDKQRTSPSPTTSRQTSQELSTLATIPQVQYQHLKNMYR